MESQSFHIIRFDLFYIFLVFLTQDQFLDTCPFGCQNLFLDTTYRKHFSTQCYFAGHRQILSHLTLGKSGDKRSDHSHTGTGPVFRYGSLGNVDMNIPIFKQLFINTEQRGMRMDILECQHGRFLHHISQISCQS